MKTAKILSITLLLCGLCSCADSWEEKTNNEWDQKYTTGVAEIAKGILGNAYEAMPDRPDSYGNNFLDAATDNATTNVYSTAVYNLASGNLSATSNPLANWAECFTQLQYINYFLENCLSDNVRYDLVNDTQDAAYKKRLKGEAYFLRAFWSFRLLQVFGGKTDTGKALGYPLAIHFFTQEEAAKVSDLKRDSYAACAAQIMADCDTAIENLPSSYSGGDPVLGEKNIGMATSFAAAALKSRVALYAASPAYQSDEVVRINRQGDFTVLDQTVYTEKWKEAATTADETIKMSGFGTDFYAISSDDLADADNATPKEFLLRIYFNSRDMETRHFPPYYLGRANTAPSQNLVDAFPMSNGYPINMAASGYDQKNPYMGRDKRFYLNVYYHGETFGAAGYPLNVVSGGKDAYDYNSNASQTGYYLAKFLSKNESMLNPVAVSNAIHYYPLLRRSEVFLNFAEAANEVWGPKGNPEGCKYSAYEVVKMIRELSGGITDTGYLDAVAAEGKDAFRELIHNERRIELAFENHRYFDMRRCLMLLNEPVRGVTVSVVNGRLTYDTSKTVAERKFDGVKYYYSPLPYEETLKNPNLENNLGWK